MIKIICFYKNKHLKSIEILGHAEANKKGHDLICAAISGISIGAIYALEGFNKNEIKSCDGHIKISVNHKISAEDSTRLEMMIKQLSLIAKSYPKNVKIIKEK